MTYRRIRSLARGIEVLRYLNRVKGANPVAIAKEVGLPRPTVHRILESLEELELVYQGLSSGEFRVTPGVRQLAGGGGDFDRLRSAAWTVMRDLTKEIVWPSDLAVFHNNAMQVIESTHRLSSMGSEIGVVGQTRSMLLSPLGLAYLSHCGDERRDAVIGELRMHAARSGRLVEDLEQIDRMVESGYRDGYIMGPDLPEDCCASIAVPVRVNGTAIASMNIVWRLAELTFEQARERLSGPLLAARDRIEGQLRERGRLSVALRDAVCLSHPSVSEYAHPVAPLHAHPGSKAVAITATY
jgi:IclR family transcriptional regulator, mhp operon transcriptional activator